MPTPDEFVIFAASDQVTDDGSLVMYCRRCGDTVADINQPWRDRAGTPLSVLIAAAEGHTCNADDPDDL